MVERRLGRGLEFLLSSDKPKAPEAEPAKVPSAKTPAPPKREVKSRKEPAPVPDGEAILQLRTDQLVPNPEQPRRDFDPSEIAELAASVSESGIIQPIIARRSSNGQYQIIAGERRWRAAKSAGLSQVPTIVRDASDQEVAVLAVIENLHRSDLNPVEKARGFRRIQQLTDGKTEDVARQVGLDRSTVTNFIRLLELPPEVLAHVSRGTLSMGHARALLSLRDSAGQRDLADEVLRRKLSVREVETLVAQSKAGLSPPSTDANGKPEKRQPNKAAWLQECEETLAASLRASVSVRHTRKKSKIVIECTGRDDFDRLIEWLSACGDS